jgi:peptide subunit release factor 1 (eRF1)
MTEGGITIDDVTKAAGSLPGKARRGLQRVREFSDRTNQWAENFRNSR